MSHRIVLWLSVSLTVSGCLSRSDTEIFDFQLTAGSDSVVADGNTCISLLVHAAAGNGRPLARVQTHLTADDDHVVLVQPTPTDSAGNAIGSIRSTAVGTVTVTASSANVLFRNIQNSSVTIDFTSVSPSNGSPGSPSTVSLIASPNSIPADANTQAHLTFTVRDANGNPVPHQNVALSGGGAGAIGLPVSGRTDENGQFSASYASTVASPTNVVNGTCGGLQALTNVTTTPGPTTNFLVSMLTPKVQNTPLSFSIEATDPMGTPTPQYRGSVTFATSDVMATLPSTYTFVSADNGARTFSRALLYPDVGAKTFTVTDQASDGNGALAFNIDAFGATNLVLETLAANAQCMTLPDLNNQAITPLNTQPCAFHSDQVLSFGNDGSLRLMNGCVEILDANYRSGNPVVINTCNGSPEQTWSLSGNIVRSVGNSNYCLDAVAGTGGNIVINSCTGTSGMQWRMHGVSPWFSIWSPSTGFVLDLFGGAFIDGRAIDAVPYNASTSQLFHMTTQGTLELGTAGQPALSYCVEVPNVNYTSDTLLDIVRCNGAESQKWIQLGRTFRPQGNISLCIDMSGLAYQDRVPVKTCSGAPGQDFVTQPASAYYKWVSTMNSVDCVHIAGGASAGTAITNAPCAPTYEQDLRETTASGSVSVSLAFPGSTLVFDGGTSPMTAGNPVTLQMPTTNPCSITWIPTLVGNAFSYSAQNNPLLALDANTTVAGSPVIVSSYVASASQLFYKWAQSPTWALSAASSQCITVATLVPVPGTPVIIQPCVGAPTQQWAWQLVGSLQNGGLCLDAAGGVAVAGASIQLAVCDYSTRQQWTNNKDLSSSFSYFNQSLSSLCLDTNGTSATGSPLTLQTCSASPYQQFVLR